MEQMDRKMEISIDRLPIKRLEAIEENGIERFPSDVGYEEKKVSQIRRIDFAWAVEDSDKKQKTSSSKEISPKPLPWENIVENLRLAHQELSVIIDLINTVEANDAVTVAGMTRPKQLPNELLSDLAVSSATKLQSFRHLGKYFKQSAKSLEQKVAKEARFYGALIRLQQSWKVKRHRSAASGSGSDGFSIDLFDNSQHNNPFAAPPSLSTLHVDRDIAGMLAIYLPSNSCHSLHFGFLGEPLDQSLTKSYKISSDSSNDHLSSESIMEDLTDNEEVKRTHAVIRDAHQTVFNEQVFALVNREACNPSVGVNMTGIRENHLQFSIGLGVTVFLSLVPSEQSHQTNGSESIDNSVTTNSPSDTFDEVMLEEHKQDNLKQKPVFPNPICYEIYLRQLFSEHVFVNGKDRSVLDNTTSRFSSHPAKGKSGLLGHFCTSLVHRIFSKKVFMVMERLVHRVSYIHLISHFTWHSRISSWLLIIKVPQSILHSSCETKSPNDHLIKTSSRFWTKVLVKDDFISVEGVGVPNTVALFRENSVENCHMNRYECDLVDLPMILLQQFASQVIRWLYEEAVTVGLKTTCDFLCLTFELDGTESLSLVAHVDPDDCEGCISWWLVMGDGFTEKRNAHADGFEGACEYSKFLGYLSLDVLYSTLMDFVRLCNGGGNA